MLLDLNLLLFFKQLRVQTLLPWCFHFLQIYSTLQLSCAPNLFFGYISYRSRLYYRAVCQAETWFNVSLHTCSQCTVVCVYVARSPSVSSLDTSVMNPALLIFFSTPPLFLRTGMMNLNGMKGKAINFLTHVI